MKRLFLLIPVLCLVLSPPARAEDEVKMPYKLESRHYIIKTDISPQVAKNIARVMDKLYDQFFELFPLEHRKKSKTEIIIWEDAKKFRTHCLSLGFDPGPGVLGLYVGTNKGEGQILAFKSQADEFGTLSVLYHEATHEFVHMMMEKAEIPIWANEGMAVYFENSRWEKGKLSTGVIPKTRLLVLQDAIRKDAYISLADLIARDQSTYNALCYSEGWALVYFFIKADGGKYRKRFGIYLKMIKDGTEPDIAFEKCFTSDTDKLEEVWKAFVLELKAE